MLARQLIWTRGMCDLRPPEQALLRREGAGTLSNAQLLGGLGAVGLVLSAVQAPLLEHADLAAAPWGWQARIFTATVWVGGWVGGGGGQLVAISAHMLVSRRYLRIQAVDMRCAPTQPGRSLAYRLDCPFRAGFVQLPSVPLPSMQLPSVQALCSTACCRVRENRLRWFSVLQVASLLGGYTACMLLFYTLVRPSAISLLPPPFPKHSMPSAVYWHTTSSIITTITITTTHYHFTKCRVCV